jgi:hypothetical protein
MAWALGLVVDVRHEVEAEAPPPPPSAPRPPALQQCLTVWQKDLLLAEEAVHLVQLDEQMRQYYCLEDVPARREWPQLGGWSAPQPLP